MDYEIESNTLRKAQLVQLEILIEFDRICKINNLSYQLFAGTLLGAIRHKGFIPWDDDIDVAMVRSDYEKLLDICKNDLKTDYFLQNYSTDPNFFRQFSRMRKDNTKYIQKGYKDIDMHHGIFIDIFPLDNVKPNSIVENIRCKILLILSRLNTIRNKGVSPKSNIFKRVIGILIKSSNILIHKSVHDKIETKIMKIFNDKDTGYLNHLTNGTTKVRFERFLMKEEDFHDIIDWEFESLKFPIPKNYDNHLKNMYGDYMKLPPKEKQKPHHGIIELIVD
ncbi:MAG: LicD family protein [Tissierellia bacterium]|nr:LicD family protein [Tissierellia bacterium]